MEKILVLDFGGQYNQLIARRVRDLKVYAEIKSYNKISLQEIKENNYKGIIFTGGPNSVYDEKSPHYSKEILNLNIPVLGICYGCQLIAWMEDGVVSSAITSEYGHSDLKIVKDSLLYENVSKETVVWMSHTDYVSKIPTNYELSGVTYDCSCASFENASKKIYAVQFHPEVLHSVDGKTMLSNFIFKVCDCKGDWQMDSFVSSQIIKIKEKVKDGKVLCALSGGVDSAVAAVLLSKAVGKQLTCVFVDHGLLRKNEALDVVKEFSDEKYNLNFIHVDASERFLNKLQGIVEPEQKRKIIGEEFIRVFEEEAKKIGKVDFLVQGTIYPDVIESGLGDSAVIKSHHNVNGLPSVVDFKEIIEPLRELFKDEVRKVGLELGLKKQLVFRQPFPGPGLGIRIIGEVTREKIKIVQEADYIYRQELENAGLELLPSQYFAGLTNMKSVGVMGDFRTYDYAIALRAVLTDDFMTAVAFEIPFTLLTKITSRIINEVKGVNRVLYDCTSKPPSTIEFE